MHLGVRQWFEGDLLDWGKLPRYDWMLGEGRGWGLRNGWLDREALTDLGHRLSRGFSRFRNAPDDHQTINFEMWFGDDIGPSSCTR